ncbi:MAG: cupin domain-containing protein [Actinomycetota bacterium]|nr:cupin domain-containing protein [Actinomycetota bacterium]
MVEENEGLLDGAVAPQRASPYVIASGAARLTNTLIAFKATARDTNGALSVSEFELGPWESGPVLHLHETVDEAIYVVSGRLDVQLGDERHFASSGDFVWMPRGVQHTFACAGDDAVRAVAIAVPGGLENLFIEQAAYFAQADGNPDPAALEEISRRHAALTMGPPIQPRRS